jgi:hypothetical protein
VAGEIRTAWFGLQVVPVFDNLPVVESKYFETNLDHIKVVVCVSEDVVAILKNSNNFNARRCFGQPFEKFCQADVPLASEGIMLNILPFVDDRDGRRVPCFDGFQQRADLVFFRCLHEEPLLFSV